MSQTFTITFDYLCPFAHIANETVIEGLRGGATWDVTFIPFSLAQTKVEDGDTPVWERPETAEGMRGVLALQWGIAVRDSYPDSFFDFHLALFDARHADAKDINDEAVLRAVADSVGLDADAIADLVATGQPKATLGEEHGEAVKRWSVFGVPTFISGDEAVFVRFMERHRQDDLDKVLGMLDWTNVNEFKRTRIPR